MRAICLKFVRNNVDPTSADGLKFKLPGVTVVFVHETISHLFIRIHTYVYG